MLDIRHLESFYPVRERRFKRNILREYLQYKLLDNIFSNPVSTGLCFMGGTCIHIVHGSPRFSEDLDFDNRAVSREQFEKLVLKIKKSLELEGIDVEVKNTFTGEYRAKFRFSEVLYRSGLSGHKEGKMMVRFDCKAQDFDYEFEKVIINKFDVFRRINAAAAAVLLSQKFFCVLNRSRVVGRDFFDIIYLMGKTKPNWDYLDSKMGIKSSRELLERVLSRCRGIDMNSLSREIEPFVTSVRDAEKVVHFCDYLIQELG